MNNYGYLRDTPSPSPASPPPHLYSGSTSSSSGLNGSSGGGGGGSSTNGSTAASSQFNNGSQTGPARYSLINKLQHHSHYGQQPPAHQVSFSFFFSFFFLASLFISLETLLYSVASNLYIITIYEH